MEELEDERPVMLRCHRVTSIMTFPVEVQRPKTPQQGRAHLASPVTGFFFFFLSEEFPGFESHAVTESRDDLMKKH